MKKLICVLFGIFACAPFVEMPAQNNSGPARGHVKGRGKTCFPSTPGCRPLAQQLEMERPPQVSQQAAVPIVPSTPVVVLVSEKSNRKAEQQSPEIGVEGVSKTPTSPPVVVLAPERKASSATKGSDNKRKKRTQRGKRSAVTVPKKETADEEMELEPVEEPLPEAAAEAQAVPVSVVDDLIDDTMGVEQVPVEAMMTAVEKEKTEYEDEVIFVVEAVPNPMVTVPLSDTNSAAVGVESADELVHELSVVAAVESAVAGDTDASEIVSAIVAEMIASIEGERNQHEAEVVAPKPAPAPVTAPATVIDQSSIPVVPAVCSLVAVNSRVAPVVVAPKALLETQHVVVAHPTVVPTLTEEEATALNTVLLKASGIVMMTPALVYLMYLLVTKRIAPQYAQLSAIMQSREVRNRLTSLRRVEAIAAALAPVLLVTGGAMVYAGS